MTISQAQSAVRPATARSSAIALGPPVLLAALLLAAILFIEFSGALGPIGFPAEFVAAIAFYYAYAWGKRRWERSRASASTGR
jgi:hypothetical protein